MKKFLIHVFQYTTPIIFFIILLLWIYISVDPYKVVKHYTNYYSTDDTIQIIPNKDHVSTMTFLNNYKEQQYDSFIFGNSRSMVYHKNDWSKHLPKNSNIYHFDASDETLFGILKKLQLIDSLNAKINNALIVLDYTVLPATCKNNEFAILFSTTPALINNENFWNFHYAFFRTFCQPRFFYSYMYYLLNDDIQPWMKVFFRTSRVVYDNISNEELFLEQDNKIEKGCYYDDEHKRVFFRDDILLSRSMTNIAEQSTINDKSQLMLKQIAQILHKNKTSYKIIVSPLYDQKKMSKRDVCILKEIFGYNKVYDFSGKNLFTEDYHNYYEESHYRPIVAMKIMSIIYNTDSLYQCKQLDSLFWHSSK